MGIYKKLKIKRHVLIKKCAECHHSQAASRCGNGTSRCHKCGSINLWGVPLGQENKIHIPKTHTIEDKK